MECPNCRNRVKSNSERCGYCGAVIPPGQYLLEQSGVVERSGSIKTPAPLLQRLTPRAATLGDRLIAVVFDSIMLLGAFVVIVIWTVKKWGVSEGDHIQLTAASLLVAGTLSTVVLFLYLWLFEGCFGATLGKIIVGIRVAHTAARSGLVASAIRNALRMVDGIGFYVVGAMVAGCSNRRQRVGDIFAGTIVLEESFSAKAKVVAVVLWLAVLTSAGWALPRVCSGGFSNKRPAYFASTWVQLGYTEDSAYLSVTGLRIDLRPGPAPDVEGVASVSSAR